VKRGDEPVVVGAQEAGGAVVDDLGRGVVAHIRQEHEVALHVLLDGTTSHQVE
jgi:hypothetical protein